MTYFSRLSITCMIQSAAARCSTESWTRQLGKTYICNLTRQLQNLCHDQSVFKAAVLTI